MSDPRQVGPQQRRNNHSPLMAALTKSSLGEVPNFCPYECQDHELDDHGYCAHLIGFYTRGTTFEPRVFNKKSRRIIVSGAKRQPMKRGYKLVKITTSARVYSKVPNKELAVTRDIADEEMADIEEKEAKLLEMAERIRNPILEGDWGSDYDDEPVTPATPAK